MEENRSNFIKSKAGVALIPMTALFTKETDERVKKSGKKTSETLKSRYSSGEIQVWNKGTKGLVKSWNKGKKGLQVAWNKGLTKEIDERVRKYSNSLSGRNFSEEHKMKLRKPKSTTINMKKPKINTEKMGKYIRTEETKKMISENTERSKKISEKLKGRSFSNEHKKNISISNKKNHQNPKKKKEILNKFFMSLKTRPTSYEKKISELLIEYNLPFIYTGDGTFLIGYKNPDFINKKDKIAIEVYHIYFKEKNYGSCENYEKQRSEYFFKYGYNTIFIRDNEINDKNWKEVCLNKIQNG